MLLMMKRSYHYKRGAVDTSSEQRHSELSECRREGVSKSRMQGGIIGVLALVPSLLLGLPAESFAADGQLMASVVRAGGVADTVKQVRVMASGLGLQAFLGKVMEKNDEIQVQKFEWQSNEKLVSAARGLYEPTLKASATREGNHIQNTYQQKLSRLYAADYSELNNLWNSSVEGLTPFGSTYRLGYEMKKVKNNLQDTNNGEYASFLGVNLSQPLLKGAGHQVTTANIRIARANADIAYEGYRQATVETVARAVQLYWQCYGAQEKLQMRRRSASIAEEMLNLNKSRHEAGKIDYTGVLDAESGLRLRQALVAAAEQTELTAKRNMLSMTGDRSSALNPVSLQVSDVPALTPVDADYEKSLGKAYKSYPQYLSALTTVEREKDRTLYAKNQRLPQLDVKGSYGYNGLDNTLRSSLEQLRSKDYLSWSLGLELNIPLFGDIKSRNEADAARLRKEQAFRRVEMQRVDLANQMEIVSGLVGRVYSQVKNYEQVVVVNAELMSIEESRFRMGKSDIRMMLQREEDYLKVRESLLDSRLAYQYALINLYALEGTLLDHYGLAQEAKSKAGL